MKHSSQRGYSLIELSIVLAIIAVVIAGAITGVQSILRANNVNRTIASTNKAVGSIVAKLVRDSDYDNATMDKLTVASMDIWDPKDMARVSTTSGNTTTTSTAVRHPFGGSVFVAPTAANWGGILAKQAFVYTLANVPVAACVDLVLGVESLAAGVSVTNVDSTVTTAAPDALVTADEVKNLTTKVSSSTVATKCGTGATATIRLLIPRS